MKTTMLTHLGNVKLCILFIFLVPFSLNTQAQGYLERQGNIATDFYYSSGKLGIGLTQPTAKVHIRSTGFNSEAFFKSEIFSGGYSLANVQNCVSIGGVNYGIHQTSTSRTMMNYFQDYVKIGKATIGDDGTNEWISVDNNVPYFKFIFTPQSGPTTFPLIIGANGITVSTHLTTDEFQLRTNPGLNYVLISDVDGNASWANPGSFTDNDWFFNHDKNLYAGAPRVGIGIMSPLQPFHCNGDLLISGLSSKLIFSADSSDGEGDYTIGYRNSGLAFQKPWDGDNIETIPDYYYLFIHNNRKLGIGTNSPRGKLEITMDNTDELPYGIILNQKSDSVKVNEIRFDMDDQEHWAIGNRFWRDTVDAFFIWNEARAISSLFVEAISGNVGIENHYPVAKLDVNGSFKAQRVGIGTNPPDADSSWKLYVEGGIMARELKITINPFPDYVFSPSYKLMSLYDLDQYILEKQHLPGIPSEAEVEANNGIEVGRMQAKLLEKIEEQTLYIITLQKQIDELKEAVSTLKMTRP